MEPESTRSRLAAQLAGSHAGGLLYGAIVTAAVMVALGGHDVSTRNVVVTWVVVLGTYYLTHVYVDSWKREFDGDERHLGSRTLSAARAEVAVLQGGVPGILVFLLASLGDRDTADAARATLWFTVGLLAVVGYLAAHYTGKSTAVALGEALGASLLGVVMVVAKSLLH